MESQPRPTGLEATFARLLDRRRSRSMLRCLTIAPPESVDFSSNSYLSLSTQPAVRAAFLALLQDAAVAGAPGHEPLATHHPANRLLGSAGSRLLDGNSALATSLESSVAAFHNAPAGLIFSSGLDANVGLFSCVPQPGDALVYDELVHASVHDGMRLSRVPPPYRIPFAHNDVASLRAVLARLVVEAGAEAGAEAGGRDGLGFATGRRSVIVAAETVYSMDGDVAPLREIVEAVEQALPAGNGYVIVDEAHATGLFGHRGRGLVCELGLEERVFARVHTFGKALGCSGAIVLCSPVMREYLINYARSLIFTTSMPFASLAGIKVAYDFMSSGHTEPLRARVLALSVRLHALLADLSAEFPPDLVRVGPDRPRSPIVPVFTAHPRSLAEHCQRAGFVVRPIVAPTVPAGTERVRVCIHSENTVAEIHHLVAAIAGWAQGRRRGDAEGHKDTPEEATERNIVPPGDDTAAAAASGKSKL